MPFLYDIGIVSNLSSLSDANANDDFDEEDNDDDIENNDNCEIFVNLMILSPSSAGDLNEQKLVTRCVVELLAGCNKSSRASISNSNEATRNKARDGKDYPSVLMRHLLKVVNVWNDAMFLNETDTFQQRHVCSFILDAMDYMHSDMHKDNGNQENIIQGLVTGITNRLEVSEQFIRQDGMMVAEKLAPILGEDLKFDELDDVRCDEDITTHVDENDDRRDSNKAAHSNTKAKQKEKSITRKKERKKRVSVEIDPDEEYLSDEGSSIGDETSSSDSSNNYDSDSSDNDSDWGEEDLIPFNLSEDDEEDLRPVPKPNYLQECVLLLQSSEDDNDARYKHDVVLTEVSSLVRDSPPDLLEIGEALTKELLYIENRYNLSSFSQLRWDGLCALAVCAPTTTIPFLQAQFFADVPLEVRLDILEVMKYSSSELCGQVELDKRRIERNIASIEPSVSTNLVNMTKNIKTRRWGHGRQNYKKESVSNKFGELAPIYFYPLLQGFVESKQNKVLWGGENGGRLLSSLLVTLSTFVECSGTHPGTSVLSSDLFEISWSFHHARNPEVRLSVLISVATCLPHLTADSLARIMCTEQLPNDLQRIKEVDTNSDCRQLASLIIGTFISFTNMTIM